MFSRFNKNFFDNRYQEKKKKTSWKGGIRFSSNRRALVVASHWVSRSQHNSLIKVRVSWMKRNSIKLWRCLKGLFFNWWKSSLSHRLAGHHLPLTNSLSFVISGNPAYCQPGLVLVYASNPTPELDETPDGPSLGKRTLEKRRRSVS